MAIFHQLNSIFRYPLGFRIVTRSLRSATSSMEPWVVFLLPIGKSSGQWDWMRNIVGQDGILVSPTLGLLGVHVSISPLIRFPFISARISQGKVTAKDSTVANEGKLSRKRTFHGTWLKLGSLSDRTKIMMASVDWGSLAGKESASQHWAEKDRTAEERIFYQKFCEQHRYNTRTLQTSVLHDESPLRRLWNYWEQTNPAI